MATAYLGASEAEPLVNADRVTVTNGALELPGDGPLFSLWRLA